MTSAPGRAPFGVAARYDKAHLALAAGVSVLRSWSFVP